MIQNHSSANRRESPADIYLPPRSVRVLESVHSPQFQMKMSSWHFHKICWVAIGRGVLDFRGGSQDLQRNDFLLLPAHWSHRFVDERGDPLTLVILCISTDLVGSGSAPAGKDLWKINIEKNPPGCSLAARTSFHLASLVNSFRAALREQCHCLPGWETSLRCIAEDLLIQMLRGHVGLRTKSRPDLESAVRGATEYIASHPWEQFQIESMAERCGMSPRRLTTIFKGLTGETFNHFVNRKRIDFACQRLRETQHILYACHESGFNDLAYFYRVFQKFTGMTPGNYVRRQKCE